MGEGYRVAHDGNEKNKSGITRKTSTSTFAKIPMAPGLVLILKTPRTNPTTETAVCQTCLPVKLEGSVSRRG
jgi:hypothetical protein